MDYRTHVIFLILCIFFKIINGSGEEITPFSTVCITTVNSSIYNVDCSNTPNLFPQQLWNASNYYNEATNVSYNIGTLNVSSNYLSKLDKQFPNSTLKVLDLSKCGINKIIESCFADLQDMEELILSDNEIQDLVMNVFKGYRMDGRDYPLRSLKTLRLDRNRLNSLPDDAFDHIDRVLNNLYLSNNPLQSINTSTIHALNSLVYLEVLDLSNCQLKELPQYWLHTPQKLNTLYLDNNRLSSIDQIGLEEAQALKVLSLNGNTILEINETNGFPTCPIKILHMCNMPLLEKIGSKSLGKLNNLRELYIAYNPRLTVIDERALTVVDPATNTTLIPDLDKLFLNDNKLSHLEVEVFWQRLSYFDVRNNPFTCECENEFITETLMPMYEKIDEEAAKGLLCAAPVEMLGKSFYNLSEEKYHMRCLDLYGNHPENDGILLVCLLIGLLLGIVLVLFGMYAYQRHWFGLCDRSPAAFSRQFYSRTKNTIDNDAEY